MNGNPMMQLMQIMQMAQRGGNPMQLIQQLAGQDPRFAQAMQMVGGKGPQQLQEMAQNMAKEQGVDLNQMLGQFGLRPSGK